VQCFGCLKLCSDWKGGLVVFGLGFGELVLILIIVVLVFGVGRLPELGTALGEGIKNFKKGYQESKTLDVTPNSDEPATRQDTKKN
jgi:sec-independent protein translocase protein TatA